MAHSSTRPFSFVCVCPGISFFPFLILSISSPSSYADFFFFDGEEVSCFFSIVRQNASWRWRWLSPSNEYVRHTLSGHAVPSRRSDSSEKRMNDKSLQSRVEVIYQSQGPSLRAVKHESSGGGGGVGGGGRRQKRTEKKLNVSERRNIYKKKKRSWGTHPLFPSTTCMSTVRPSFAEVPCHDVKTLMD